MISLLNSLSTAGIVLLSVFGGLLLAFIVYLCFVPLKSYFTALFSGCFIPTFKLIAIKNRKLDVKSVVENYIFAKKSKLKVSLADIENATMSGANCEAIIKAMILMKNAGKNLDFALALAIDMAGSDVYQLAENSIQSKLQTIEEVKGKTQDGYELAVKVQFSSKINIEKYAEALGMEDLKSTVSAWIMENISRAQDHKVILQSPNNSLLTNLNLEVVTSKSMYTIEDINIQNVEITKDYNHENELKSAEKERVYAQIEADRLKNAEEIRSIQMKAKTEAMKSEVLAAEAEVPRALSEAIKEGRFSVMDYYKLMNLQADTALRRSIINEKTNSNSNSDFNFDDFDEGDK